MDTAGIQRQSDIQIRQCMLHSADNFLDLAHKFTPRDAKSETYTDTYNKLIKSSLNCMMIVIERYKSTLDVELEVLVYLKLAQTLLGETVSYDLASEYCMKGLQLVARLGTDKLSNLKFKLQILNFQIQYKLDLNPNKKSTLVYLNSIIKEYEDDNYKSPECAILLKFLKFQYFGMTFSTEQCFSTLRLLSDQLYNSLTQNNFALFQLITIYEIQQLLFKYKPINLIKSRYERLINSQTSFKEYHDLLPVQFKAITALFDLLISIQEDDFNATKQKISQVSQLIHDIRIVANHTWQHDFKFTIFVPIKLALINSNDYFPIEINWLNFKEFSMLSYMYSGVSYVIKSWDGKKRTDKLFKHCHRYLDEITTTSGSLFTLFEFELKTLTCNYFHVFINFYELLADLQSNVFNDNTFNSKYKYLDDFIKKYDSGSYSSQELVIYHRLLAKVYYTLALRCQKNGDFERAKYHYMKIRKLYSNVQSELSLNRFFNDTISITFTQSISGIGGSLFEPKMVESQIYVLSSINLLILTIQDLKNLKSKLAYFEKQGNEIEYGKTMHHLSNALKLKDIILNDELSHLQITEDPLLNSTLSILQYLNVSINELTSPYDFNVDMNHLTKSRQIAPLLASILYYIMGKTCKNDPTISELDNLNRKIQLFDHSFKQSVKLNPGSITSTSLPGSSSSLTDNKNKNKNRTGKNMPNLIGYLANLEIYWMFMTYRNHFSDHQVNELNLRLNNLYNDMNSFLANPADSISMDLVAPPPPPLPQVSNHNGTSMGPSISTGSPLKRQFVMDGPNAGGDKTPTKRRNLESEITSSFNNY